MTIFFGSEVVDVSSVDALIIGSIVTVVASVGCAAWCIIDSRKSKKIAKIAEAKTIEIARRYILRTILINLKVIFSGGDERTKSTEDNRDKFLQDLSNYLGEYTDKTAEHILKMVRESKHVPKEENPPCEDCVKIVNTINAFLNDPMMKNPGHEYKAK